jgi:Homeodomain-like domain
VSAVDDRDDFARRLRYRARGGITRERLEALVAAGLSIAEIAHELDRSKGTVRHWLRKWRLQTVRARSRRRDAVGSDESARPASLVRICKVHGETVFFLEGRGYYRCGRCRAQSVSEHRRRMKAILVAEAGGRCVICGYDRHPRALEFHHRDPPAKEFGLALGGITVSLDALRRDAAKCVLLCSNCHAEVEDGLVRLPVQ